MVGIQTLIVTLIKEIKGSIIKGNHCLSWMHTVRSGVRFCYLLLLQTNPLQLNWIEWEPILISQETKTCLKWIHFLIFSLIFFFPLWSLIITLLLLLYFILFFNLFNATNSSLQSGFKGINLNMQVMTCSSIAILLRVTDYAPSVVCVFYLIVYYLHISPFPCVCSFQANRGSVWSYWTSRWIRTTYISSGVKVHFSHITNIDQTTDKPLLQHLYHICIDLHRTCIPQLFFVILCSLVCVAFTLPCHWKCSFPTLCLFLFLSAFCIGTILFIYLITSLAELVKQLLQSKQNVFLKKGHFHYEWTGGQ